MAVFSDDTSAIPSGGCTVITSSNSLSWYNGNIKKDFYSIGGKWYQYRTQTTSYGNYDISSYTCTDITGLNSNAQYVPIYGIIAFFLFICSVILFVKSTRGLIYGH